MSPRHLRRFLAAGTGLAAVAVLAGCAPEPSPEVAVRTFLLDWQAGAYEGAARQTDGDTDEVAAALEQARSQLDIAGLRFALGPIERDGETATAEFDAQADLGIGDPVWHYTGSIDLQRGGTGWQIKWSPSVIHPELGEDERLAVSYDVPDRGQIYDRNAAPLVGSSQVTAFGVIPSQLEDLEQGVGDLAELLEEDPDPLIDRVRSAPPEEFQPLVLLRTRDVDASVVRQAGRIPGADTAELRMQLNPTFARGVVGEVAGTAEHNVSSRVAGNYQAGDTVGLTGLQNVFQQRLAGTATTEVVTLDSAGEQTGVLQSWPGVESGSLTTTLDTTVQESAEASLEVLPGNGYIVALDSRNGEILAAAGAPDATDNDGAFTAEYRPGDAFTIVSAAAALQSGVAADDPVPCEQQVEIGDRSFSNPNYNTPLQPDLNLDFTHTCTTAFAGLGEQVGADGLGAAAADFGIGGDWRLSVPTYNGEFAAPGAAGDTAAAMVGQDHVTVSPLSMALVAGGVADGSWHPPRLAADDDRQGEPGTERELDPAVVEQLRAMMRSSVELGTPGANIGVVPVHGKAASAAQQVDGVDTAVQWFVGYQGPLAFAVVAEVDPAMEWDQYAVVAMASFLQQLPPDYVEGMADSGAAGAEDAPAAEPDAETTPR
ncbi:penicillin-binding transpeptidase domain-containing protein [Nocardiopsis mangrovi]|uniref:Penicillin-binding transpeptidase domain-containing protein n=1 Tax=Nocardiopsis mangrovi TaxID=1179818 RepID=A0ABV9DUP0_9ACTN